VSQTAPEPIRCHFLEPMKVWHKPDILKTFTYNLRIKLSSCPDKAWLSTFKLFMGRETGGNLEINDWAIRLTQANATYGVVQSRLRKDIPELFCPSPSVWHNTASYGEARVLGASIPHPQSC